MERKRAGKLLWIVLAFAVAAACAAAVALHAANQREVPILMYHHLVPDDQEIQGDTIHIGQLKDELSILKEQGYEAVTLQEVIDFAEGNGKLPRRPVCITFDDGYLSNYELGFPLLKEFDMKATIFVIGATVGNKEFYKDTEFHITPHFDTAEMKEMADSGLVLMQSHSYDLHQWAPFETGDAEKVRANILPLEGESDADYAAAVTADITRSRQELEAVTGQKVEAFAYPGGKYLPRSEELLSDLGVKATLTIEHGTNLIRRGKPETLRLLKRYYIADSTTEDVFRAWLDEKPAK